MIIGKKSNFGISVKRERNSYGTHYLTFVFWFPVKWNKELGYRYTSIRWL